MKLPLYVSRIMATELTDIRKKLSGSEALDPDSRAGRKNF